MPATTAATLDAALAVARRARAEVLERWTTAEILETLAAAAAAWRQPHFVARTAVLDRLAAELAMARPMLERGLDGLFASIDMASLEALVEREAESPSALDHPVAGARGRLERLAGPPVVFHSLAGNVPGLAIPHIVAALIARSIAVVRDSERQPLLTTAFVETLAQYAPELAAMVIPATWRSGDMGMERLVFEQASRIEVTGSDRTMRTIVSRHPRMPIITRGTRLSIGLVPRRSDTDWWKDGFAEDIVMYEGLGCLTPHIIFVEGAEWRARRMAQLLGVALSRLEMLWPRQSRDLATETARRRFVSAAELSVATNPGRLLLRGRRDEWVVHLNPDTLLEPGPGLRCVTVAPVADRTALIERLARSPVPLAGVGLGMEKADPNYATVVRGLTQAGATLIADPGRMQMPPLDWAQDGHARLADLLDWRREDTL